MHWHERTPASATSQPPHWQSDSAQGQASEPLHALGSFVHVQVVAVLSQQPLECEPFGQTPASSGIWQAPPPAVRTTHASPSAHVWPLHAVVPVCCCELSPPASPVTSIVLPPHAKRPRASDKMKIRMARRGAGLVPRAGVGILVVRRCQVVPPIARKVAGPATIAGNGAARREKQIERHAARSDDRGARRASLRDVRQRVRLLRAPDGRRSHAAGRHVRRHRRDLVAAQRVREPRLLVELRFLLARWLLLGREQRLLLARLQLHLGVRYADHVHARGAEPVPAVVLAVRRPRRRGLRVPRRTV